jgi:hypothetical protein
MEIRRKVKVQCFNEKTSKLISIPKIFCELLKIKKGDKLEIVSIDEKSFLVLKNFEVKQNEQS